MRDSIRRGDVPRRRHLIFLHPVPKVLDDADDFLESTRGSGALGDTVVICLLGPVDDQRRIGIIRAKFDPADPGAVQRIPTMFKRRNCIRIDPVGIVLDVECFLAPRNRASSKVVHQRILNIVLELGIQVGRWNIPKLFPCGSSRILFEKGVFAAHADIHITLQADVGAIAIRSPWERHNGFGREFRISRDGFANGSDGPLAFLLLRLAGSLRPPGKDVFPGAHLMILASSTLKAEASNGMPSWKAFVR